MASLDMFETLDQVFEATEGSYLAFIHLLDSSEVEEAVKRVVACEGRVPDSLVHELIRAADGSWRETLLGLVLASLKGPVQFAESMLAALARPRGLCLVPLGAALLVACEQGFPYSQASARALDREPFNGEVGYALDCLEHALRLGAPPTYPAGPNDGQSFAEQCDFYRGVIALAPGP